MQNYHLLYDYIETISLILDIETTFLHKDIDIEIYMDCSKGLEHKLDDCIFSITLYIS